jgi:chemotaxis protein methyltransferase CheR
VTRFSSLGRDGPRLSPDDFAALRDLFTERLGIAFGAESRFALERRLRERVVALNLGSFAEYCDFLRHARAADPEWDEAVDLCTTNETYFFREDYQLRSFAAEVLPALALLSKGRKRLSIWSAGCSTGEEVFTIAILVQRSGQFDDFDVRVFGSDISKRCVAAARRGVYPPAAFRATPPDVKRDFFVEKPDGFHVVERIRAMCQFGQMNLLDAERVRLVGRADAIFCRNVLIYFGPQARKQTIDRFHERLYPGGVLLLGHSESLLNVTTAFELLHLKEDLAYRKPLGASRGSRSE